MFHRLDSLDDIEATRFISLAKRLIHYEGAIRHEIAYEMQNPPEQPKSMAELVLDPVWGQLGSFSTV